MGVQFYKVAGLTVAMDSFGRIVDQAKPYQIDRVDIPDVVIRSEWEALKVKYPTLSDDDGEYLATGKSFYQQLLKYDGFMLHSSAVVVDGNAYLFTASSGTGKSTSIKAIVNEFYPDGLRMVEIYKHQFKDLSAVIAQLKNRNYKFIIYMDDLSFEEFEIEYKFLKAVIEGGVETKPDNILIYATSNRRHLIKETWKDRNDVEQSEGMHRSDTMEEKLSLVNRFGVTINYSKPTHKEYYDIVLGLAHRMNLPYSDEELVAEANKWELFHGGISGRTAQQFINYMAGKEMLES